MDVNNITPREIILGILLEITENGAYSHLAIRSALDKYQYLGKQDRSFITRICEGTLERMITIDYIIGQFSTVKVSKMKPVLRGILRFSVYELKYMDSIPPSATCNEAVKLAQKKGFRSLKGFVNAVLRNIARNLDALSFPDPHSSPLDSLSITYSMPLWILELWKGSYSLLQIEEFLKAFLSPSPTTIRINPLKTSKEDLISELKADGIKVSDETGIPNALFISNYDYLGKIPAFQSGKFYVQDLSSMRVSLWAAPKKGDYVIDVCAAPGGKSIHMAELMEGSGIVEARDISPYKVSFIKENIERCQLPNIRPMVADARILEQEKIRQADIVIADLPCSGLGALGKRSDMKYKLTPQMCQDLVLLQREILHTVQQYVKPGGVLMYSTCTINPAENEENVSWFLESHPHFTLERQQQILPEEKLNDGFFLAKLLCQATGKNMPNR